MAIEPGQQPTEQPITADAEKVIPREAPVVDQGRSALVKEWVERIEEAKEYWGPVFEQMRKDADFANGKQWPGQGAEDDRYRANITLRHINQRVSSIYAKNPRVRALARPKLYFEAWDGTTDMLVQAMHSLAALQDPMGAASAEQQGLVQPAVFDPAMAQLIVDEANEGIAQKKLYDRMGKTLEIVAQHSLDEPIPKFKLQAKQLVRRVLTCKVGYVKLGYQRIMEYQSTDIDARMKDATDRLAHVEQLTADLADGEITADSKEAEELKLLIGQIQQQAESVMREGVVYGFPKAWSVIPDPDITMLKGFVGAEFIAEEYILTPKKVQKIYGIDVGKTFNPHTPTGVRGDRRKKETKFCAVYEVYDLVAQSCFTVCSGYPDYLKEPADPNIKLEQGHPYFALTFNDVEDPESPYPQSDVELMRPMQMEYNRGREGLRVHRQANVPAHVTAKGVFDDDTKGKLSSHAAHEILETNLSKADDINKVLMPKPTNPIQKELYDVEHVFVDTQRVNGDQAANLGGTSGSTATESSIAENSRVTTIQSNIDDLDEFLTDLMRCVGQVLFMEMSKDTVLRIAGPKAAWPDQPPTRTEVAEELVLEIKAGSSGRPNRNARLTAIEKTGPFLLQLPGIEPKKIAEFMLTEIDENIEIEEFYKDGLPSVVAQNAMAKPNLAPSSGNSAQAAQGVPNATAPAEPKGKGQNMYPAPDARAAA